jgi:hypothetical protein
VHISDAPWHNDHTGAERYGCTSTGYNEARDALLGIGARHIGVFVDNFGDGGLPVMQQMSLDTGTVDAYGEPLVAFSESGRVSESIVEQIDKMAEVLPQDVTAEARDVVGDPRSGEFDATGFVSSIRALYGDPPAPEGFSSMDGATFYDAQSGTRMTFEVTFENTIVPSTDRVQFFRVLIVLVGEDWTSLNQRQFIIVVPPLECRSG